ncbi:MAG: DUF6599 family protein [Bacteroidales bacterium]
MRNLLLITKLFFVLTITLVAQPYSFPEFKGYKIKTNYPVFTPDNLWDFINGAADGYISYGFENVHVREYVKERNVIKVEIYKHNNQNNTFGIYASERSPSFRYINIGAQGYITGGSLNFFKGLYYVKMRTYSGKEKILTDLESLAYRISDMLPGEITMPETLTRLPGNNRIKYSETFINQSVLGHEFLSGAYKAEYKQDGTNFSIFLFEKDNPEEVTQMVKAYLSVAGFDTDDFTEGKYVFRDGYNGDIFLAWKGTRMVIIQGLAKDQSAIADRYTGELIK